MNTYSWGLFPEKAVLFDIINVLSVLTLLYNIAILLSAYRHNEKSFYRYRFNFLLFGTVTIAIMSLGNIPAMNGYNVYPLGNFIFIPSAIFAIALFKHNILELIRLLCLFLYYGSMSAAFFAVVYNLTSKRSDNLFTVYTLISILSILLLDRLLIRLRDTVTGRQDNILKIAFENLSDKLSRASSINEIAGCVSYSCFTDLFCGQCAVLIYDEVTGQYRGDNLWNINRGLINPGMPVF